MKTLVKSLLSESQQTQLTFAETNKNCFLRCICTLLLHIKLRLIELTDEKRYACETSDFPNGVHCQAPFSSQHMNYTDRSATKVFCLSSPI